MDIVSQRGGGGGGRGLCSLWRTSVLPFPFLSTSLLIAWGLHRADRPVAPCHPTESWTCVYKPDNTEANQIVWHRRSPTHMHTSWQKVWRWRNKLKATRGISWAAMAEWEKSAQVSGSDKQGRRILMTSGRRQRKLQVASNTRQRRNAMNFKWIAICLGRGYMEMRLRRARWNKPFDSFIRLITYNRQPKTVEEPVLGPVVQQNLTFWPDLPKHFW